MPRNRIALPRPSTTPVGVVGLELMRSSIATFLLAQGHPVAAVSRRAGRSAEARRRIRGLLEDMDREGRLDGSAKRALGRLTSADSCDALAPCSIVFESIVEDLEAEREVLERVE